MKKVFLSLLICTAFLTATSQDKSLFQKQWFIQNGDTMPYRILLPINYNEATKYPVIFVLHGSGEKGSDNEKQLIHGTSPFLKDSNRINFPAIVIFPQCAVNSSWSNMNATYDSLTKKRVLHFQTGGEPSKAMKLLLGLLDDVRHQYPVDKRHLYVGGLSMGGMGTFELVRRKPKTFAAAFPICGGANPATAKKLRKTSWWLFHGLKDDVVDPALTKQMEDALKKVNADVQATYYPNANHNSWDSAFAEPTLLTWLFSKKR